ncbi:MAG TPA: hypothetical protein VJ698_03400 [Noviherbaspirillum sp.]|uniref:hypothetical protein n=1 Tax=Noviherbaspirillum sp. TaxID=1926288 RepID=UPI002B476F6C|nr:hypothetical protein [Noviherbaspirillum sp.]HJV84496.1 hypothetical protein [Noviherbaspirillum sp.]
MSAFSLQEQERLLGAQLKAEALDNWRPLNLQYKLDAQSISGTLRKLYAEFSIVRKGKHSKRNRRHLKIVIADVVRSYQEDPEQYLAVSLNSNDYKANGRYNTLRVSYRRLRSTIELLHDAELIELHTGYFDRSSGKSAWTRVRATPKLIAMLNPVRRRIPLACSPDHYEPIVLREGKPKDAELRNEARGRLVEYDDTADTVRMRDVVRNYVSLLHEHHIENPADERDWEDKPLIWRKFCNSSWESGGRFYGGNWQNCKRDLRPHILIDGERTIELDYVALHACLAYARKGIGWWENVSDRHLIAQDPYGTNWRPLTEKQWRYFYKKALNVALAATSERSSLQALYNLWRNDELSGAGRMPLEFKQKGLLGIEMRRYLGEQGPHVRIVDLFFQGIGLNLQYWDSQVAEAIFLEFVARGKPVLGIHDSFIVKESDQELLQEVMSTTYQRVIGFKPKFTSK